jgi:hypothetical protein
MSVTVHNLDTYTDLTFVDLTYREAVRNAHALTVSGNTWDFDRRFPLESVHVSMCGNKRVYSLGAFSAVETVKYVM